MGKRRSNRKGKGRTPRWESISDEMHGAEQSPQQDNWTKNDIDSGNEITNGPLCRLCSSVFSSPKQGWPENDVVDEGRIYKHQPTLKKLSKAMESGCYVCGIIHQELSVSSGLATFRSISYRIEMADFNVESIVFGYFSAHGTPKKEGTWREIVRLGLYKCDAGNISTLIDEAQGRLTCTGFPERCINSRLSQNTKTEESLMAAFKWLQACRQGSGKHSGCILRRNHRAKLPTRLVYCGNETDPPRISEGRDLPPDVEYLTLSHCWGTKPIFSLTTANEEQLKRELPTDRLTRSFLDAIFVTRILQYEYIWIDSLCIIQDSHEDWAAESVTMGDVYADAVLNIAATGVASGEKGFFTTREAAILPPLKVHLNLGEPWSDFNISLNGDYWLHKRSFEEDVENAPLNARGWVLQERILSPRVLHFGINQIYWECPSLVACEVFPTGFPSDVAYIRKGIRSPAFENYTRQPKEEIYGQWRNAVQAYSSLAFTKRSDRFRAIGGIASEMSSLLQDEDVAGLWKGDLLRGLLWAINQGNDSSDRQLRLGFDYTAPTWSWKSLDTALTYIHASSPTGPDEFHAEVLDVRVTSLDAASYGPFSDGCVRIKGPVKRASIDRESHRFNWLIQGNPIRLELSSDFGNLFPWHILSSRCTFTHHPSSEVEVDIDWGFIRLGYVYLLPIRSGLDYLDDMELYGLLLMPTSRGKGEYHRIGLFSVQSVEDQRIVLSPGGDLVEDEYEELLDGGQYAIKIV